MLQPDLFFLRHGVTFPIPSEIGHATEGSHWRKQGKQVSGRDFSQVLSAGVASIGRACKYTHLIPGSGTPYSRRTEISLVVFHDWEFKRHGSRSTEEHPITHKGTLYV